MIRKLLKCVFLVQILIFMHIGSAQDNAYQFDHKEFSLRIIDQTKLSVILQSGQMRVFDSTFTVFFSKSNPRKTMIRPKIGKNQKEEILYKVPAWGKTNEPDYYNSSPFDIIKATKFKRLKNGIQWIYDVNEKFSFSAKVTIPNGAKQPELNWELIPKSEGYFSVGYTGAPSSDLDSLDELWQPMIWQEKRFPGKSFLTEAFMCPLPSALVSQKGVTVGVLADSRHLPFMPIPKSKNSQFGIMLRNEKGLAQPALFAPVLGGAGSRRKAGQTIYFRSHLICREQNLLDTFKFLTREYYNFKDHRKNTTVTLNKTFENMIDYCMSEYSQFVPELRGASYATDVPGAVKNITGLHPLSLAIITDNEEIFRERARPMVEYGYSRERFLFATNPEINRDGTSARLEGPGVPMSDFSTVYTFSQNRMKNYLDQALEIYTKPINRSLNLTAQLYGDRWQNAMYLYTATKKKTYLELAVKGADEYIDKRIRSAQTDYSDRDSRGMFFWTSYIPQWMELYLLYELTKEKRFLEAARTGALRHTQMVFFAPEIPIGKVTVNKGNKVPRYRSGARFKNMTVPEETVEAWRVSEIGLTPESSPTCHGHRAKYLAQYSPWMLRVAQDTNDKFLHDIARSAIIGRYESFPGYHINAGRTTGHEKVDFALRSLKELNGVTSLHYNHPWPHAAKLIDYMVSEVYYRSGGKLDFPSEYAEGYAYCRSKVYGAKPGKFFDGSDMYLYMPKGLAESSNVQINYVAARTSDSLVLMLTNQSTKDQLTVLKLNSKLLGIELNKNYQIEVWKEGKLNSQTFMKNSQINAKIPSMGLIVLKINSINLKTVLQERIYETKSEKWTSDKSSINFGGGSNALLLNFGSGLQSAYIYTKANSTVFKKVTLHYALDGNWNSVTKGTYPYEFTISIPDNIKSFKYKFSGVAPSGVKLTSVEGHLNK